MLAQKRECGDGIEYQHEELERDAGWEYMCHNMDRDEAPRGEAKRVSVRAQGVSFSGMIHRMLRGRGVGGP